MLYDVNPGEGFNLRRDVFMRMAVLVKKLNEMYPQKFVLVTSKCSAQEFLKHSC